MCLNLSPWPAWGLYDEVTVLSVTLKAAGIASDLIRLVQGKEK